MYTTWCTEVVTDGKCDRLFVDTGLFVAPRVEDSDAALAGIQIPRAMM